MDDGRARRSHSHHHHHHDQRSDNLRSNGVTGSGGVNGLRSGGDGTGVVHELEDPLQPNAYESHPKKGKGLVDSKHHQLRMDAQGSRFH
jgi:hypothetical protein